jgi:hypothetical protein
MVNIRGQEKDHFEIHQSPQKKPLKQSQVDLGEEKYSIQVVIIPHRRKEIYNFSPL